jgi:hypothetical protein
MLVELFRLDFIPAFVGLMAALVSLVLHPVPASQSSTQPSPCAIASVDTSNWEHVDTGSFTMRIPPGYRRLSVRGIDSDVGSWEASARRVISYDWGEYSNGLSDVRSVLQDVAECRQAIGGHGARLFVGLDPTGNWIRPGARLAIGAAWRSVRPTAHLTITAASDDESEAAALAATIKSVRFK